LNLPVNDPTLTLEHVEKQAISIALPKRHPLTRHTRVPLAELADQKFVLFPRRSSPGLHDLITDMCRNAGFTLNVIHEVDNILAAMALVAAGLGLAFSTPTMQKLWPDVAFRPLRPAGPPLEYAVGYRKDAHSPVLDAFMRVVRETSRRSA
jgi:DNA-binding transcriptional LysR family regulator